MKSLLVALLGLLPAIAGAQVQLGAIDLTTARLERLASEDPDRYVKVTAILRAAETTECETEATRLLKASHDLKQMHCAFLILTSFPAKRHVYFVLENVAYSARIVMARNPGRLMKADLER
jgi:hypothetical protein